MTPRSGSRQTLTLGFAGGPLAGTVNYLRPDIELIQYFPHTRHSGPRAAPASELDRPVRRHGEVAAAPDRETLRHDGLPFYDRFSMGGENQVRGFEYYSIPAQVLGVPGQQAQALRGDRSYLFNAEYYFDVFGPVRVLAFFDAGHLPESDSSHSTNSRCRPVWSCV